MKHQSNGTSDRLHIKEHKMIQAAAGLARLGCWEYRLSDSSLLCSSEIYRLLGTDPDQPLDFEALTHFHPTPDRKQFAEAVESCMTHGNNFDLELKMKTTAGGSLWVRSLGRLHTGDDGNDCLFGAIQDISRQKSAEKDLKHQKWLMQAVVENIPHMVFVKEAAELRHILFNKAGEDLTGISKADFLGKNAYDLFPEKDAEFYFQKDRAVFKSGKAVDIPEESIQTRYKGQRLLHTKKIPIMDQHGNPIYLLGICEDITERVTYQGNLERAKKKAEAASRAKGQFLARMSHEIRTPLNLIIGMIDLVLESRLDEQQKHYMDIAVSSAHNLLHLINDILDFSKIEENRMTLEQVPFNLMLMMQDISALFTYKATEKGLGFHIDMDLDENDCRAGDPHRLRQILINIIGNAVKFTDQGRIDIIVRASGTEQVDFHIKDTGIGIPRDRIDSIFESFTQAEAVTTRRYGGSGLGITIAKKLVELMNGTISVESIYREGSAFKIRIPLPVSDESCAVHDVSQKGEWVALKTLKILVVDDIKENIELARIRLERKGHEVDAALNGSEAITKIHKNRFDLVLMDVHMPVMSGIDAVKKIREKETSANGSIPIIALTASVMKEEQQDCLDAGMDDVAGKPIDFQELFVKIENLIPGSHRHYTDIELPLTQKGKTGAGEPAPLVDMESGIRRWQSQTAYFRGLDHFRQDFSNNPMPTLTVGDSEKVETTRQFVHKLKGLSGNLALKQLFSLACELEAMLALTGTPEPAPDVINARLKTLTAVLTDTLDTLDALQKKRAPELRETTAEVPLQNTSRDRIRRSISINRESFSRGELQDTGFNELLQYLKGRVDKTERQALETAVKEFEFGRAVKILEKIETLIR